MAFNFQKYRPYASDVSEIVMDEGNCPLNNEACKRLSNVSDATQIFALAMAACIAAQQTATGTRLGITPPPPIIALSSGLAANDLRDLLDGDTNIAYNTPGCPRAYAIRGTVGIPDPNAPAQIATTVTVDVYVGMLIAAITGPITTLVFKVSDNIGTFSWV